MNYSWGVFYLATVALAVAGVVYFGAGGGWLIFLAIILPSPNGVPFIKLKFGGGGDNEEEEA